MQNQSHSAEVVRSDQIADVLKLYHNGPAHPGINLTIKLAKQKYFWLGMSKDIRAYVSYTLPTIFFVIPYRIPKPLATLLIYISKNFT